VFAQIVDEARGVVVGNQATPIPVTLDGQPHTLTRSLEGIAISVPAGGAYTLQITGGTQVYGPVRDAAAITFSAIRLAIPVPTSAAVGPAFTPGTTTTTAAKCVSHRRFRLHLRRGWRHDRVTVARKRVKVHHGRERPYVVVDLRGFGKRTVKVRINARSHGRRIHRTRTFHTCK
jgi:ABC-2 type transport system ATP-binding protein